MSVYLLSYPRSGNFWTRYIIEYISKRPTQGYDFELDGPIGSRHDLGVDLSSKPIAIKSHEEIGGLEDEIILIVRDYKEAITRHAKSGGIKEPEAMKSHFIQETQGMSNQGVDYIKVIEKYDTFPGRKMMVYYENLMENHEEEIRKILAFLQLNEDNYKQFMVEYDFHYNKSVCSYHAGSHTYGKNIHFHVSSLSPEYVQFMNDHIKTNQSNIYNRYLTRYG